LPKHTAIPVFLPCNSSFLAFQGKAYLHVLLQGIGNLLARAKRVFLFRKDLLKIILSLLSFLPNPTAMAYDMVYGL